MSQLPRLKYKPVPGEFKFRQPVLGQFQFKPLLVAEKDLDNAFSIGSSSG
jgi:hypothetical protein